jgi:hypothetical protein
MRPLPDTYHGSKDVFSFEPPKWVGAFFAHDWGRIASPEVESTCGECFLDWDRGENERFALSSDASDLIASRETVSVMPVILFLIWNLQG